MEYLAFNSKGAAMNKEMMKRMKIAGRYQRKALRALFPEEMSEHLDVIEKEIKAMFMESVMEMVMEQGNGSFDTDEEENKEKNREKSHAKKVDIL